MAQPRISIKVKNWNQTQHGGGAGGAEPPSGNDYTHDFSNAVNSMYIGAAA